MIEATVVVLNSNFTNNTSPNGKAGVVDAFKSSLSFTSCRFTANKAKTEGGVFFLYQVTKAEVLFSFFKQNTADNGGVYSIDNSNALFSFHDCQFHNNSANFRGGVGYATGFSPRSFYLLQFFYNKAQRGAVIYDSSTTSYCTINYCTVSQNTATVEGVIYADNANNIGIYNSNFYDNIGGSCVFEHKPALISKSNFTGEVSSSNGGVVRIAHVSNFTSVNSMYKNNKANAGGVLYSINSTIFLREPIIMNNSAIVGSGMVLTSSHAEITNGDISYNTGGAIFLDSSSIEVSDSSISNNSALSNGGAVSGTSDSSISFWRVICEYNTAWSDGGCIYTSASTLTVRKSEIRYNSAQSGGGVYSELQSGNIITN